MGSVGLNLLVTRHRRGVESGCPLRLVVDHRPVLVSIRMTGLDRMFTLTETVEQALALAS